MKDLSSSRGLQSIVICSRLFNANCTLFHTGCGRLTKKVILSIVVILLTLVPFTSIYLSLIEIYVVVDLGIPFLCGGSHSLDACKTASSTEVHVLDKASDLEYCGNSPDSGSLYIDLFISDRDLRHCRLRHPIFVRGVAFP